MSLSLALPPRPLYNSAMDPLETYLKEARDIHSTGAAVDETSYYGPLAGLFNEIGKTLKPKVRCIMGLKNTGAGMPDGGLFTPDQFQKSSDVRPLQGQSPSRGAIEVKPPSKDARKIAQTTQVLEYLDKYGLVLVTTLREFLLLGADPQGNPVQLESYRLAEDEAAFWSAAVHPQKTAQVHGERFGEYLKRVMLSNAPLSAPQDVAFFLASYARDARARIETVELPALAAVRDSLEEALGMKFTGERGEHFFRSTLVQTIFYGVFSAWVLWHRENPDRADAFDWRMAEWSLRVPFIRALYEEIATPTKLGPLGLVEVLDWTAAALKRVDRAAFFQKFQDERAVQYFYEPFLEAFDPQLRKELGVWYTPPEIVKYQVARVDAVLREELDLADGLADPNVIILDPCCGTGAYLVEVLHKIAETLKDKGGDALVASDLKKAAMTRVFGFEILPAPFVVSHLQLGLMLHRLGAPLSVQNDERVGVYLTNSLTGWEPPKHPKQLLIPELALERDAADKVKREAKVLVVLGNPPYNAFAGVSPEEEQGLVEPYKKGLNTPVAQGGWGIKKFNLDDLYVRFFRLAERRIAEMTGKGVVSFISNFSYLGDPSFVVMRQRYLAEFDRLWFDCMNGDSRETGKLTPEGEPDPSVFSTEYNREGIRVGTAVCVVVRKEKREVSPIVRFRHFWGAAKRQDLLASIDAKDFGVDYAKANPCAENRFSFRPESVSAEYNTWPKLDELPQLQPSYGHMETRGLSLISHDEAPLVARMKSFFDKSISNEEMRRLCPEIMRKYCRYEGEIDRAKIQAKMVFSEINVAPFLFKPFDVRYCYGDCQRPLWSEPSIALSEQSWDGNFFLITRMAGVKNPEGFPIYFASSIFERDIISGHARALAIRCLPTGKVKGKYEKRQISFFASEPVANLSATARTYLARLEIKNPDEDVEASFLIWMHALAVGYSPAYLSDNADGIRRDWPRIPLPDNRKALEDSAVLGRQVAALLDTESEAPGVTAGRIEPIFKTIGVLTKVGGGQLNPEADALDVTAGWGHAGKEGVTMPAKGRTVQRPYDKAELEAIGDAAKAKGLAPELVLSLLGPDTRDVYLNDAAYWKNVPANVWEFYIGGYQVIKKWLSYREKELLGRGLRDTEAREVMNMARRLAAIVLLQPALDENYRRAKSHAYPWPKPEQSKP